MAAPTQDASFYADFSGLAALKRQAKTQSSDALRAAAQQFEALFTQMMLKSMRDASFGDSLTDSNATELYQGMFDQQLSTELSKGKGFGLADMLIEQLQRQGLGKVAAQAAAAGTSASEAAGTSASAAAGTQAADTTTAGSRSAFVEQMLPYAQKASQALGVDATTLIAHAALETGWGKSLPSGADGSSNNLFGIKTSSNWQGSTVASPTLEYENGIATARTDGFKAYASPEDCFKDYVSLLGGNARYAAACNSGSDVAQFASALQEAGYATDPQYAAKLQAVASSVSKLVSQR